jgi:hypothetical protein
MESASSWSWVTKIEVTPNREWRSLISARIFNRSAASRLEKGSSKRKHPRLTDDRPPQRHALLLPTRKLAR